MTFKLFKAAFLKTLPVMAGYLVLGAGFGILLRLNGFGVFWALLMSVFIYAGSMQFAGVSLISGGASLVSVALTTLMVNARHLFYGISMLGRYKGKGLKKLYLMLSLTDETYSLVVSGGCPEGESEEDFYFFVSLLDHIYWVLGSVLGSFIGSFISSAAFGIEFSMTALFVTVFTKQWLETKEHRPALIGLGASLASLLIFGKDSFLIPSMALTAVLLTALRKPLEKGEKQNGL